jgi:hypothetical protein
VKVSDMILKYLFLYINLSLLSKYFYYYYDIVSLSKDLSPGDVSFSFVVYVKILKQSKVRRKSDPFNYHIVPN